MVKYLIFLLSLNLNAMQGSRPPGVRMPLTPVMVELLQRTKKRDEKIERAIQKEEIKLQRSKTTFELRTLFTSLYIDVPGDTSPLTFRHSSKIRKYVYGSPLRSCAGSLK